jgi:hypothetical protein
MEEKGKKFTPVEKAGERVVADRILHVHRLDDPQESTSYSLSTRNVSGNIIAAGSLVGREQSEEVTSPVNRPQTAEQNEEDMQGWSEDQWDILRVKDLTYVMKAREQRGCSQLLKPPLLELVQQLQPPVAFSELSTEAQENWKTKNSKKEGFVRSLQRIFRSLTPRRGDN